MAINRHVRRALIRLWGPSGSILLHILVLILIVKWAVTPAAETTKPVEAVMDVVPPAKALEEVTADIDKFKEVPIVEDAIKPPDVSIDREPPRVDALTPVGPSTGGGGGGEGAATGAGNGSTEGGTDAGDFNVLGPQSGLTLKGIFAGRSAGGRGDALAKYGGGASATQATEYAVKKALEWLKAHQQADGSWGPTYRVAMTGLAVLTYLAHDETTASVDYGDTVRKGLRFLLKSQKDGVFAYGGPGTPGQVKVYEHAIGTYAISEAYGMTSIPFLKVAMEDAVQVIIDGQNEGGSWCYDYNKGADAPLDVSVSGWQLQALKAAAAAGAENKGLHAAIEGGMRGLKAMLDKEGTGMFRYSNRGEEIKNKPTYNMTGVAVLCMQLAGHWQDAEARAGMHALEDLPFRWAKNGGQPGDQDVRGTSSWPLYGWYYITQARFQQGGKSWNTWNKQFALLMAQMQNPDGSWCPAPQSGEANLGPVYCTTLPALMLQVYYRFLPTFQPIEVEKPKNPDEGSGNEDIVIKFG